MARISLIGVITLSLRLVAGQRSQDELPKLQQRSVISSTPRPVTVADSIEMNRTVDDMAGRTLANYSPDGKQFIVVLRRGIIDRNVNEYSLLMWRVDSIGRHDAVPEVLLRMCSSSNRPAIETVTWLEDNRTIVFLGEHPGEAHELYSFNIDNRVLKKLTNSPTSLLSYSSYGLSADAHIIAYTAEEPLETLFDANTRKKGFIVSTEWLPNLAIGKKGGIEDYDNCLFWRISGGSVHRARLQGRIGPTGSRPYVSNDGRHIIISTLVKGVPSGWKAFESPGIRRSVAEFMNTKQISSLRRYELVDTTTGRSRILLDAPLAEDGSDVVWLSDNESVVITNIYLPSDTRSLLGNLSHRSSPVSIKLDIVSNAISIITDGQMREPALDVKGQLILHKTIQEAGTAEKVCFSNDTSGTWHRAHCQEGPWRPEVILDQNMNSPPRLFITARTGNRTLLLDLNPQFRTLRFARVEEVHWKGSDGRDAKGGLYYPINYVRGKRYPLVIQTHQWDPTRFWIDGPWTTAFAAQSLAGHDIMVLQADEDWSGVNTPEEVDRNVAMFEGAIDFLDGKNLIDRDRVGIVGFSRTCLFVKYALTHSHYHFAAASVTDGADGGYFQYLTYSNSSVMDFTKFAEGVIGSAPYGAGLSKWLARSPSFSIEHVSTPVRIVAEWRFALFNEWEWFASLHRLGKPVEMVLMDDGSHILEKPWDRIISQQGSVDWFCFWLKGEEDRDPQKAAQYGRWHLLRAEKFEQP